MPAQVNPIPFYENCVKDSCACDSGGDCECFCTAVAAYAQACNEVSVCVAWRTPEICRKLTLTNEENTSGVKLCGCNCCYCKSIEPRTHWAKHKPLITSCLVFPT